MVAGGSYAIAAGSHNQPQVRSHVAATQLKLTTVKSHAIANPAGTQTGGTVKCPSGQHPTGGGLSGTSSQQRANASYPAMGSSGHAIGWTAYMNNDGGSSANFFVYVICTPTTNVHP